MAISMAPLLLLQCLSASFLLMSFALADPTSGFGEQKLQYEIQKPYNLSLDSRYSLKDGVHTMWVFKNDKPFKEGTPTAPRTELRVEGLDYSSGVWQFEADFYIPSGSTGMTVMQVFGRDNGSKPALMMVVMNGNLERHQKGQPTVTVATGIYERWVHLNVIHDTDARRVQIFLDNELRRDESNGGTGNHYFKCGVYTASNASNRMESRWRNIKILKKL